VHLEQGLKLNPSDANALAYLAGVLVVVRRAEEGVEAMRRAMALNPYHPEWYWLSLSMNLFEARRYDEALAASQKATAGKRPWHLAREAACLAQLGRMDEARAAAEEVLRMQPDFSILKEMPHYKFEDDGRHVLDLMRKAGLPD
jgi:adenylate cyclase